VNANTATANFKAQAIVLISGVDSPAASDTAKKILSSYNLNIADNQSISMAGRLILAILIDCDPAHVPAIEDELRQELGKLDLDVAIEVI